MKFHSRPTVVDQIRFPSQREANRYGELKLRQMEGTIQSLVIQPRFRIELYGQLLTTYIGDFSYYDVESKQRIVEDAKAVPDGVPLTKSQMKLKNTPAYRLFQLKRKLLKVIEGIEVRAV